MRIALLHYTKPPTVGGVERVLCDQAGALQRLGHEVVVLDRADWLARGGAGQLSTLDAVLVHNVFSMPFDLEWTRELTQLAALRSSTRWVNWVHDVAAVNPAYAHQGWAEPVPQAIHVAVSKVRADEWAGVARLPPLEVNVIPNGVAPAAVLGVTPKIAELADQYDWWTADLLLVQPVRLVRRKNIELGIELVAQLIGRGMRAHLIVTGAPDPHQCDGMRYFEELIAQRSALGVEQAVTFAGEQGTLSNDDVGSLYRMGDALFFPSHSEGFGLPLLEAALHRLPIWCSDLPVHREVIGQSSHFFDGQVAADALADRMTEWMTNESAVFAGKKQWQAHSWELLCKERLEPLLCAGM